MKTIFVVVLAFSFLITGALNVLKQIKITGALEEIVRFINLVKTELRYTTAGFEDIFTKGKAQNYKYLSFSDGEIFVDKSMGSDMIEVFNGFVNRIGTTDEEGQLELCDEYKTRFQDLLMKRKLKEKEKLQVNTALSLFGALTVLIFFL